MSSWPAPAASWSAPCAAPASPYTNFYGAPGFTWSAAAAAVGGPAGGAFATGVDVLSGRRVALEAMPVFGVDTVDAVGAATRTMYISGSDATDCGGGGDCEPMSIPSSRSNSGRDVVGDSPRPRRRKSDDARTAGDASLKRARASVSEDDDGARAETPAASSRPPAPRFSVLGFSLGRGTTATAGSPSLRHAAAGSMTPRAPHASASSPSPSSMAVPGGSPSDVLRTSHPASAFLEHVRESWDPKGHDFLDFVRWLGCRRRSDVPQPKLSPERLRWLEGLLSTTATQPKFVLRMLANAVLPPPEAKGGTRAAFMRDVLRVGISPAQNQWLKQDAYDILVAICNHELARSPEDYPGLAVIPPALRTRAE